MRGFVEAGHGEREFIGGRARRIRQAAATDTLYGRSMRAVIRSCRDLVVSLVAISQGLLESRRGKYFVVDLWK